MADPRAPSSLAPALPAPPEALVAETWILDPPGDGERAGVMRPEAAAVVDGLLARVARGRGALDVAIGEQLDALSVGDHFLRLGYSNLGDYARERLGVAATTARGMAKLARELRARPLLREAVRSGEVSPRKAQVVLPVARAQEQSEATWIERARKETVRALEVAVREARCGVAEQGGGVPGDSRIAELAAAPGLAAAIAAARPIADEAMAAVKAAAGGQADGAEEPWDRVRLELTQEDRARLDRAMALAGRLLGAGAPRWQRLEAICQEYLGAHPVEPGEDERAEVLHGPVADWLDGAKEALEREMSRWDFLEPIAPVPAPSGRGPGDAGVEGYGDGDGLCSDPLPLDARLRELAAMRERWDVLLGHLAMLMKTVGLWRDAGFASFGHYCEERLGLAARTVEQRAVLARRSYELPGLREAMTGGRLPYEKARLVAQVANEATVGAWMERARTTTVLELRREIEAREETQMCARGEVELVLPRRVRMLLDATVRAARIAEQRWMKPGECLGRAAEHFVATWEPVLPRRRTRHQRLLDRDEGRCQVPGCSRAAVHAHHVVFRSAGGDDDEVNLVSLCAAHHLHGVHAGWIGVRGEAPDRLSWRMAAPPVEARELPLTPACG